VAPATRESSDISVATPTATRPGRIIAALLVLIALVYGLVFVVAPDNIGKEKVSLATKYKPRLGLDLEGGTSVILTPRLAKGAQGKISKAALSQAVSIIRSRVDSFGVAEAEVATAGNTIVISVPGKQDKNILDTVKKTAQLRFRRVLLSGSGTPVATPTVTPTPSGSPSPSGSASPSTSPSSSASASPKKSNQNDVLPRALRASTTSPSPSSTPTPSATPLTSTPSPSSSAAGPTATTGIGIVPITAALQAQFNALNCTEKTKVQKALQKPGADAAKKPLVTCEDDGSAKYILGPAVVLGTEVKSASAGLDSQNGVATGGWVVNLSFNGSGRKAFGDATRQMVTQTAGSDLNRFAIVLDGLVVSAPQTNGAITDGNAQISGTFTQTEATSLANVLKYGALPLTFDAGDVEQVSATLGGDQLRAGLTAGVIGLLLVVFYSLLYYRGLGLVTVASLCVSAVLTYGMVVMLGWQLGFRLSLAGVAGLIVAIGITADSFIVFFERLRDEVREGRTLRVAVENGWVRARRTILAADFVSFLAAMILYILSAGSVRGFAFTLGLTTLIDIVVVFMFTKPVVTMLARTEFFGQGHRFSGLDPERLGSTRRTLLTPAPRGRGGSANTPATEA
jgi:preprotein translocase subunit SecD